MRKATAGLLVAAALGLIGCGGGDGDGAAKFKGIWTYAGGTSTVTCQGFNPETSMLTGNITIASAVGADLLYTDGTCSFRFDVIGSNAQIVSGQSCVQSSAVDTLTLTPQSWLLTTLDGRIMMESGSGNGQYQAGGASVPCTFTASGTLNKIGS